MKKSLALLLACLLCIPFGEAEGFFSASVCSRFAPRAITSQAIVPALFSFFSQGSRVAAIRVSQSVRRLYPRVLVTAGATLGLSPLYFSHLFSGLAASILMATAGLLFGSIRYLKPMRLTPLLLGISGLFMGAAGYTLTGYLALSQITVIDLLQPAEWTAFTLLAAGSAFVLASVVSVIVAVIRLAVRNVRRVLGWLVNRDKSPAQTSLPKPPRRYGRLRLILLAWTVMGLAAGAMRLVHTHLYHTTIDVRAYIDVTHTSSISLKDFRDSLNQLREWPRDQAPSSADFNRWLTQHLNLGGSYLVPAKEPYDRLTKEFKDLPAAEQKECIDNFMHFILTPAFSSDFPTHAKYFRFQVFLTKFISLVASDSSEFSPSVRQWASEQAALIASSYEDSTEIRDRLFEQYFTSQSLTKAGTEIIRFYAGKTADPESTQDQVKADKIASDFQEFLFAWRPTLTPEDFKARTEYWENLNRTATPEDRRAAAALIRMLAPYHDEIVFAAKKFRLRPGDMATLVAENLCKQTFGKMYTLKFGVEVMERWYKNYHLSSVVDRLPERIQLMGIPNTEVYPVGGALGTDARQSDLVKMRGYSAMYSSTDRLPEPGEPEFDSAWPKSKINLYLNNPDIGFLKFGGLLHWQFEYIKRQQAQKKLLLWPDARLMESGVSLNPKYTPFFDPNLTLLLSQPGFGYFIYVHTEGGTAGNGITPIDYMDSEHYASVERIVKLLRLSSAYDSNASYSKPLHVRIWGFEGYVWILPGLVLVVLYAFPTRRRSRLRAAA